MQVVAVVLSLVALLVSLTIGVRQVTLARHANSTRVLVDLFKEHRDANLAEARRFVYFDLAGYDITAAGLDALPRDRHKQVRDLLWFYDNLGLLVYHDIVSFEPVRGYLGGSMLTVWSKLEPLVAAERAKRASSPDPSRWAWYCEELVTRLRAANADQFRPARRRWYTRWLEPF
ncbi:hypothetical protein [Nocardia sp. NPDC050175]|uniref:DUF4760 domain-containing protein n=1 Tax=Nocardia sp. NPDC050175 TaxID=3364317 RepID=UPI0037995CBA